MVPCRFCLKCKIKNEQNNHANRWYAVGTRCAYRTLYYRRWVGAEVTPAMQAVVDAAIRKAYGGKRRIEWKEVLAGERAFNATGSWLPDETMETFQEYLVGIKGPLTTPVGGGIRSLNVALRQTLDLYVCLRPVRWYQGVQSPVKSPEKVNMCVFRENTEDIYAGIEWEAGTRRLKSSINS